MIDIKTGPRQTKQNVQPPKSTFAIDVLKMSSPHLFTQALGIVILPLITRLYAPEAFGLFALFSSIVTPIGVFSTLGYSSSIMLPKSDDDASNMLAACLAFTVLVSGLSILLILFWYKTIIRWLKAPELNAYLWFIPLSVFLCGLYMALRYWNMRKKRFGHIASAKIFRFTANNGIVLGAGYSGHATGFSLILGSIAGAAASPIVLSRRIWRENRQLFKSSIRRHKMLAGIKKYRKFPMYILWTDLISRFSGEVPIYFLSYYFTQSIVGYYSLGLRLLTAPMSLLGSSIGEVFFQRGSQSKYTSTLPLLLSNLFERLVFFGILPFFLLGLIGEELFTFAFGAQWAEAGVYAQILSFLIFIQFITIPASYLMLIFEKQQFSLILNIIIIFATIASLTIGGLLKNVYVSFFLLSLLNGLAYAVYGFWFINHAGLALSNIFKTLWRFLVMSLPVLIAVSLAKWFIHLSPFLLIIISCLGAIIFYGIGLKRDAKLQSLIKEIFLRLLPIKTR